MKKQIIRFILCSMILTGCSSASGNVGSSTSNEKKTLEVETARVKTQEKEDFREKSKEETKVENQEEDTRSKQVKVKDTASIVAKTSSKTASTSVSTSKPKAGTSSSTSSSASSSAGKTESSSKNEPVHVHSWQKQYKTIHHEEVGHNETVVVSEAWDEAVYTMEAHDICNNCGLDFTATGVSIDQHFKESFLYGDGKCGSFRTEWIRIQTRTVHHEAETQTRYVVDQAAYDEQVADGYRCSTCGATK